MALWNSNLFHLSYRTILPQHLDLLVQKHTENSTKSFAQFYPIHPKRVPSNFHHSRPPKKKYIKNHPIPCSPRRRKAETRQPVARQLPGRGCEGPEGLAPPGRTEGLGLHEVPSVGRDVDGRSFKEVKEVTSLERFCRIFVKRVLFLG